MTQPSGLCDVCAHQQVVRNTRGSVFSLCRRSRDEPDRFPRYPRLPVLRCAGFDRRQGEAAAPREPPADPPVTGEEAG